MALLLTVLAVLALCVRDLFPAVDQRVATWVALVLGVIALVLVLADLTR